MQEPSHSTMSLPVSCIRYLPRFLSGAKTIGWSSGMEAITFLALDEVQTISVKVLTSAEQLIYVTTVWLGYLAKKALKASGGQPSANEQPASISGTSTFFLGLTIFAFSAI